MGRRVNDEDIRVLATNILRSISQSERPCPGRIVLWTRDLKELIEFGDCADSLANLIDVGISSPVDVVESRSYMPQEGDYRIPVREIFSEAYLDGLRRNPSCGLAPEDFRMGQRSYAGSQHDVSGE